MRSFPRAPRRRALAATLVALTVGGLAAPSSLPLAHAERDKPKKSELLKQRQQAVQGQIEVADEHLEETSAALREATARLNAAEAALGAASTELAAAEAKVAEAQAVDQQMQAALEQAQAELDQARADLQAGTEAAETQRETVRNTMLDIVEDGDPRLLALASLLNATTAEDITRQEELNDTVVSTTDSAYDRLRAAEAILSVRKAQVRTATQEVERQREAAAAHLQQMQVLESQAVAARDAHAAAVTERESARVAAEAAKQHDIAVLRALEAQEEKIKDRILRAIAREQGGVDCVGGAECALLPPVNGPVTSPFGMRRHPIYGYWGLHDGTDFGIACGEPMRAVADGKVVASYWSDVYGHRLYLNVGKINGKSIVVIYNHAESYTRGVGATIARGDIIGHGGNTGWSTGCHLHFTVLENGQAVDPMKYL